MEILPTIVNKEEYKNRIKNVNEIEMTRFF